mmetsp:Transcript_6674/g.9575  ORF Transcript_6674/g.9575 Transcript_6674/m.9575 type:complete len:704 (+) Transcript_6674:89-2200(+)
MDEKWLHFDRKKLLLDGDLSIFDYNRQNALLFSQGDWQLIRRDLAFAGIDPSCIQELEDGPCTELIRAFRIRRELIHYKKVCLHLFEEGRKIERELKQAMAFFFWNDGENKNEGSKAHLQALHLLSQYYLNDNISPLEIDAVSVAMKRHCEKSTACELVDRKILYVLATGAIGFHKGISLAIQDARNIAKSICLSPRHPDGERPLKLRNLPASMYVDQAVHKIAREDPFESRDERRERMTQKEEKISSTNVADDPRCSDKKLTKSGMAYNLILEKVRDEHNWPTEAIGFLSSSIVARGGYKALTIVEELENYSSHLSALPSRTKKVLQQYMDAHNDFITISNRAVPTEGDEGNALSAAVKRVGNIHSLRGLLKASGENAKWVSVLASLSWKENTMFVAGDDAANGNNCMFVPQEFELGNFINASRKLLEEVLMPAMLNAITSESWPPQIGTRRTRVAAYDEHSVEYAKCGRNKLSKCMKCSGYFDAKWIRHTFCIMCERRIRDESVENKCLFDGCKLSEEAFCPHFRRCFVCDSPHSCEECRLYRGDGESAIELVSVLQPRILLLDFDRTLCSTKSGASPLPQNKSKSKHSRHQHTIDSDLKVAVAAHRTYGSSHVITRNSHKRDIEEFLIQHDLKDLASNVHVVPKKMSKGSYIKDNFFTGDNSDASSCIFIDDDIRELVRDNWLKSCEQVHRLLFVRAFSK